MVEHPVVNRKDEGSIPFMCAGLSREAFAPVVQSVEATGLDPVRWGFESLLEYNERGHLLGEWQNRGFPTW